MTQLEFIDKLKEIFKQEEKYGVEIEISQLIDKDHLDCLWYGGDVGTIKYRGYTIVIGAHGDIRIGGRINGAEIDFKDKNNSGAAYEDIAVDYNIDDSKLYSLIEGYPDSFKGDENNYLSFENNNWFEVDLFSPDGEWIDLCGADNVLDNNLLDCFSDVSEYFEYVDNLIKEEQDALPVIDIPLENGYHLVAEQNTDPSFSKEIFIGIKDKDGVWHQDLAVVRNSYIINDSDIKYKDGEFDVLVYSDKDNEDFTHDFTIGLYKEEKE